MSEFGCQEIAHWFTHVFRGDRQLESKLLDLLRADSPDFEAVADLVAEREPGLGALVRDELRELPRPASLAVLRAWRDAVELGVEFVMVSEWPEGPLAYARRRLVRVITDVDDTGITVRLSHVPGRHPAGFEESAERRLVTA